MSFQRTANVRVRTQTTLTIHGVQMMIGSVLTENGRGESMALSNYEWIIVHKDGETEKVEADSIYEVVDHCGTDEQPVAIVRGDLKW